MAGKNTELTAQQQQRLEHIDRQAEKWGIVYSRPFPIPSEIDDLLEFYEHIFSDEYMEEVRRDMRKARAAAEARRGCREPVLNAAP